MPVLIVGGGWTLIAADGDPIAQLDEGRRSFLRSLDATVASLDSVAPNGITDVDGRLTEWLGQNGAHAVLVRPDFYVFGSVASRDGLRALVSDLRAQLAATPKPLSKEH